MTKTLILFPDTNLFFQCKAIESLDWNLYAEFEEIRLYVTRPVQSEVDEHKGKGSGRLSKRARSASTLFRELLRPGVESKVLLINPRVVLFLRQDLRKDDSLSDQLDYHLRDDQLVGIAAAYAKTNLDKDVRILTHDTGPMATAKLVGVAFEEIPENWLLAPETDEAEKNLNKLKTELARYQNAEPLISMQIHGGGWDADKKQISLKIKRFCPLTSDEVEKLMMEIKERFPVAENFGSTKIEERVGLSKLTFAGSSREVFTPASAEAIENYRLKSYPDWLASCEDKLRNLHAEFEVEWPSISVVLSNDGSRPALDVLVNFSAKGDFFISTHPEKKEEEPKTPAKLPNAPRPPSGSWSKARVVGSDVELLGLTQSSFATPYHEPFLPSLRPSARDPNAFYYKSQKRGVPYATIQLECEQWRHRIEADRTDLLIYARPESSFVKGSLHVEVHGSNMTQPFICISPVSILTEERSVFDMAIELIEKIVISQNVRLTDAIRFGR